MFLLLCFEYMVIIKLKTESQTVNRKPHRKVNKTQVNILPFLGLAQSGTEQLGQGATLLGWPKSIYYVLFKGTPMVIFYGSDTFSYNLHVNWFLIISSL